MVRNAHAQTILSVLILCACSKTNIDVGTVRSDASAQQATNNIGAPCSLGLAAGVSQGVLSSGAPECSSGICLKPAVATAASGAGVVDTTAFCTAPCATDAECDGLLRDPSNPNDKSCVSGYACGLAFVDGAFCCQKFCVCKDFNRGPMLTPITCPGFGETCHYQVTEFTIPTVDSYPLGITPGPDGNLWFTEEKTGKIGRITPSGEITEFVVPSNASAVSASGPWGITAGPDGNLWFADYSGAQIGRITTSGIITTFPMPSNPSQPIAIAAGPDGNLWFTDAAGGAIGRITPAGSITEFTPPATLQMGPEGIVAGLDGNLWFAMGGIGRITPEGTITKFVLPSAQNDASGIAVGPDGNLWFTDYRVGSIGRITTEGIVTEFPQPTTANAESVAITAGPDGTLWYTSDVGNSIGRVTTAGVITEFAVPTPNSYPSGITVGPDGNIWFTEATANQIARIVP